MFDTNIKQTHNTDLFLNRTNEKTSSHQQILTPNLHFPLRQQSVKSLNKIKNHYKEFQHALNMLKISVEDLWRLELVQLQNHESISSDIRFDSQVPSIYTCRAVLPMMISETIQLENRDTPSVNSPINIQSAPAASIQEIVANKMNVQENMVQPSTQSISSKEKSAKSLLSIKKKRRKHKSGKNFTKYGAKTALLHLKFRCLKHLH